MRPARIGAAALAVCCLLVPARPAVPAASDLCDAAAAQAARETGVPAPVLLAITRTETGRNRAGRLAPWPWTVYADGAGHWFDTRRQAQDFVAGRLRDGAGNFDVGCFQINHRWHGTAFRSTDAMFDPLANARYAARFLIRLHAELGDWSLAAGAFHSRTEPLARRYRTRFERILATLPPDAPAVAKPLSGRRVAAMPAGPLLPQGAGPATRASNGSLVPLGGARKAFISLPRAPLR